VGFAWAEFDDSVGRTRREMTKHVAIGAGILLGVCCGLAALSARTPDASAAQADRARIDAGKRLLADTCQNDHCHGGSARNMEDHSGFTAAYLRRVINDGLPEAGMQAFKDVFTPEQVEQLVAYILSVSADRGASAARTSPRLAPAHSATTHGELSGDATGGRALFFAATQAQNCLDLHMNDLFRASGRAR
jgi:mono/diheme cytochrome c family protein